MRSQSLRRARPPSLADHAVAVTRTFENGFAVLRHPLLPKLPSTPSDQQEDDLQDACAGGAAARVAAAGWSGGAVAAGSWSHAGRGGGTGTGADTAAWRSLDTGRRGAAPGRCWTVGAATNWVPGPPGSDGDRDESSAARASRGSASLTAGAASGSSNPYRRKRAVSSP